MPPKKNPPSSGDKDETEEADEVSGTSSESSNEDDDVLVSKLVPAKELGLKVDDADEQLEQELEDELEKLTVVSQTLSSQLEISQCIKRIEHINSFSNVRFQDILPQVSDGRKFLIDGDSLLLHALTEKGFSMDAGGQTLHAVYTAERFMQTFLARGLNFSVVFFETWGQCWSEFPEISLMRQCLKLHFLNNQKKFPVLTIKALWTDEFAEFLHIHRPGFIMMATSISKVLETIRTSWTGFESPSTDWLQFVSSSQALYCEFLSLDVVDINSVHYTAVCLMASVHIHVNNFKEIQQNVERMILSMGKKMPALPKIESLPEFPEKCVRVSLMVWATASLLNKNSSHDIETVLKTVLLCVATLEHTPLKMRCFKNLPKLPQHVSEILANYLKELSTIICNLSTSSKEDIDFRFIGDLWQGLFFNAVYQCVCEAGGVKQNSDVEKQIADRYEVLISLVNKSLKGEKLAPYPIDHICEGMCGKITPQSQVQEAEPLKLIPSTCKVTELFVGKLTTDEKIISKIPIADFQKDEFFHESRHWHNKKAMTDEYERIPDTDEKYAKEALEAKKEPNKRYAQNYRNTMARYLTLYGSSLEGRSCAKVIVTQTQTGQKQKKVVEKPKPQGKGKLNKKEMIIQENQKRIMQEKQKQLKERVKTFSKIFAGLMLKCDYRSAVEKCDIELQRAADSGEILMELLFMKGKAWFGLYSEEMRKKTSTKNFESAQHLFLVIREIFRIVDEDKLSLDLNQKNLMATWLHDLGFKELAKIKALPDSRKNSGDHQGVGMNHVEFQLTYLGAELLRDTGGKPDSRVEGFTPDPWQSELFDIIDRNQSALVVAPTSSGKTYASYYCMEKVARDSDDGVVVYVCPTKALVNQVHATIYARFRKNLPPGKSLLGVFTRDYRQNVMTCQILVTVPECMELVLLSPRSQTWARRIKYVIFDEVHCLVGQSGGLSWENSILLIRCPFLALSATVYKPEAFCAWLQKVEDFKKAQAVKFNINDRSLTSYKVNLVVHTDRHNHLLKNIMTPDGAIQHVHPYSFLNLACTDEYKGIPDHIALAPDEVLELYNAMNKVLSPQKMGEVSVNEFFEKLCPSGYISLQAVKKFSDKLKALLEEEPVEIQMQVLQVLRTVDYTELETGDRFLLQEIPVLVDALRRKGMLPALVFTYNRLLVEALPRRLLRHLRRCDDFVENEETDIEEDSESEGDSKGNSSKRMRKVRGKRYTKKLGILRGPSILNSEGSLRGEGFTDEKMIDYVEHRLVKTGYKAQDPFPSLLRRGLGKHYAAMNNKERSAVEMLFRSKILNLVTATGTLALGIHMPCKTVVVAGDSPYLNVLEFNQMSGRAGRRGFDKEGNVVFFGLNRRKMETLMTANLPQMIGNFPLSASLILRVLLFVSDATFEGQPTEEATNVALARALTLLENGLLYELQPSLKQKMKYYYFFVIQFLMQQGLLSRDGHLHTSAMLITHLHYHEPGNFAFYYLVRSGALEQMCECDEKGNITESTLTNLMIVLNFLFARLPLSEHILKVERVNSLVVLPELPPKIKEELRNYNSEVLSVFSHFFRCIASHIEENFGSETKLPLSDLHVQSDTVIKPVDGKIMAAVAKLSTCNHVCSAFAGLSGNSDLDLFPVSGELIHIRDELNVKVVPTIETDFKCNSYALDFYKHGIKEALVHDNGLRAGYDFSAIKDFMLALQCLHVSLTEMMDPDAKLVRAMCQLTQVFKVNFEKAYYAYGNAPDMK